MEYVDVTVRVAVRSEDSDVAVEGLKVYLDRLGELVTVFDSEILVAETAEPANAAEIEASVA